MVMIVNLRPATVAALNTCIQEIGERYDDSQQQEILDIVADVLGQFPPKPDSPADGGAEPMQSIEGSV